MPATTITVTITSPKKMKRHVSAGNTMRIIPKMQRQTKPVSDVDMLQNAITIIKKLKPEAKKFLRSFLTNPDVMQGIGLEEFISEQRFTDGYACPLCGCVHVIRNGHRKDGTQRFLCKECGKAFTVKSNSITAGTHKSLEVWENYVECMMLGLTIRKTAELCGIHKNTAFLWRHKILDALQTLTKSSKLDGIIEADETFFDTSYKGNHTHSKTFKMPRKARKRGHSVHTRGISREKVCVPCAVSRKGDSFAKVSNLGRVTSDLLNKVFEGKIDDGSILVTDAHSAYVNFAYKNNLQLKQIKGGKASDGIYNIQRINNYHSQLGSFMRIFRGVATKYLNNYLAWHGFMNIAKNAGAEKQRVLLESVLPVAKSETCRAVPDRPAMPVLNVV